MLTTLAFRHLMARKLRSVVLLLGFVFGVAAMIVLLSVGQAMLDQSRDVSLVGGGEVTVLPQGIDVEALRTGGAGAQFFGIDRARFMARQVLGGPRQRELVTTVAPVIERKLVYLQHAGRTAAVRAGGEIPSRSRALGAGLNVLAGRWEDAPGDSAYLTPTPQQLYDELDRFHRPHQSDSTWAEWHYFNVVTSPDEWWYVTYMVRGDVSAGRGAGVVLITHRRVDGRYERFTAEESPERITFDTARADLVIGKSGVRQRNGTYYLQARAHGVAGALRLDLEIRPERHQYFPRVEVNDRELLSGYVVPALAASASGRVCVAGRCVGVADAPAYHDHNWGVWRDVTWEWGTARGTRFNMVYGGVYTSEREASPFFLAVVDSLGIRQMLRFGRIDYQGARPASGTPGLMVPARFSMLARRGADTLRLDVMVDHAVASRGGPAARARYFVQMRGRFRAAGRVAGQPVADSGAGFFETYLPAHAAGNAVP
jgi:hypothetical protein